MSIMRDKLLTIPMSATEIHAVRILSAKHNMSMVKYIFKLLRDQGFDDVLLALIDRQIDQNSTLSDNRQPEATNQPLPAIVALIEALRNAER